MESTKDLAEIDAPYGKHISIKEVAYDNGFKVLRVRIKEGKRFTDMDLDQATVEKLNEVFSSWRNQ